MMEGKPCIGFSMENAVEAYKHMETEAVEEYGDHFNNNWLHTWDDGERVLLRCKNCGGYILCQTSEYHGMEDDDYYADYFPVSGSDEAHKLNEQFDGDAIETDFPGRWLICDPCRTPHWNK